MIVVLTVLIGHYLVTVFPVFLVDPAVVLIAVIVVVTDTDYLVDAIMLSSLLDAKTGATSTIDATNIAVNSGAKRFVFYSTPYLSEGSLSIASATRG